MTGPTPTAGGPSRPLTDASLACAEALLADGKKAEALAIYKGFASDDQPKHVRLAATRGMLACTRGPNVTEGQAASLCQSSCANPAVPIQRVSPPR